MKEAAQRFPAALLLPPLALAALVWLLPLVYTFTLSFTDAGPGRLGDFVGLTNYARVFRDPALWRSFVVTCVFALGAVLLQVGAGFGLALAFHRHARQRAALQFAVLLPWAVADLAVALVWHEFLGERQGLFNWALASFGAGPLPWKTTTTGAMAALWLAGLWHGLAFSTLLQMAGLASLPANLPAAARLDGASRWLVLRAVLLPHQRRVLLANALLVWLGAMVSFSLPFALTGGGPLGATEFVSLYAYDAAFGGSFEVGYAAAVGVVILAVYSAVAFPYLRRRRTA